jgi:hypothetical protein
MGHREILQSLLAMGKSSDAALSEMLGEFYGEVLKGRPVEFLAAIRPMPVGAQNEICWLAGGTDGSGMPPDLLRSVGAQLKQIGDGLAPILFT